MCGVGASMRALLYVICAAGDVDSNQHGIFNGVIVWLKYDPVDVDYWMRFTLYEFNMYVKLKWAIFNHVALHI